LMTGALGPSSSMALAARATRRPRADPLNARPAADGALADLKTLGRPVRRPRAAARSSRTLMRAVRRMYVPLPCGVLLLNRCNCLNCLTDACTQRAL